MKPAYYVIIVVVLATAGFLYSNYSNSETNNVKDETLVSLKTEKPVEAPVVSDNGVIFLSQETFKKEVFDYSKNKDWKYLGKTPAIVDFYADWCRPCKMLEPTLIELQKEYGTKIQVYKVNTDKNPELASAFGIQGIPALLFIPMEGQPQMSTGLLPKETLESNISSILKVTK